MTCYCDLNFVNQKKLIFFFDKYERFQYITQTFQLFKLSKYH